jgi:hypothetical protein
MATTAASPASAIAAVRAFILAFQIRSKVRVAFDDIRPEGAARTRWMSEPPHQISDPGKVPYGDFAARQGLRSARTHESVNLPKGILF